MKAQTVEYPSSGGVKLAEIDVPDPAHNQVQIQTNACGVCAWDLYTFKNGGWCLPGHEGIGRVVKIGAGITKFKVSDRVTGICLGFARLANLNEEAVYKIPECDLPDEHFIVEPVACAVTGIDHCHLRSADRVALIGCGFMGLLLMQILGRSFADTVVAIDIDSSKLEMAKKFGASETHNSNAADFSKSIPHLKSLEFDTVIDASGAQAGLDLATKIVKKGGRINLFGWNHGTTTFDGSAWHGNGLTIVNSTPNSALRDTWPVAIRLLQNGIVDLRPLVTHTVPLPNYQSFLESGTPKQPGYIKSVVKTD